MMLWLYIAWCGLVDLVRLPKQRWNDGKKAVDRMYRDFKERR